MILLAALSMPSRLPTWGAVQIPPLDTSARSAPDTRLIAASAWPVILHAAEPLIDQQESVRLYADKSSLVKKIKPLI